MAEKRILILGGGFGGVYAAMHLEKLLPRGVSVTLVNRENYFVFQPLLPEVISGAVGLTDVVAPIRRLCPRTKLILREVEEIDLERRTVALSRGFRPRRLVLAYDHLVIALGGVTNFSGMPGLVEHGMPFKTLADALVLRSRLIHALAEADIEDEEEPRRKLLTFVVAGGGFSGVEIVAQINDFVRLAARSYPRIDPKEIRCVLVHKGERILPEMVEDLAHFAQDRLRKRGVEIRLNDRLRAASSEKAVLASGEEIPCRFVVSTVPAQVAPPIDALDCEKERGRLLANEHLELVGHEGRVWTVGDCAIIRTKSGETVPPTAQHAIRQAQCVAENIAATINSSAPVVFDFGGLGKLASLGHRSAVAQVLGLRLSGFLAWFFWRTVYLLKMPGLDRKIRIGVAWFMDLVLPPDLVQLNIATKEGVSTQHLEPGETVFEEGDLGDSVYVIESGECEVLRGGERIAVLSSGESFGEMAVLSKASRNATVKATTRANVLVISKKVFDSLKTDVPAFGEAFQTLAAKRAQSADGEVATKD